MDKIYESIMLCRIKRDVTEEKIFTFLMDRIGKDPALYEPGGPRIRIFQAPESGWTWNAEISGIKLTLRDIERKLKWHRILDSNAFLRYPLFGVELNKSGTFDKCNYPAHIQMMEANGFLYAVDIFASHIANNFGDYNKLRSTVYVNTPVKKDLNWSLVERKGMLHYGSTLCPFKNESKKLRKRSKDLQPYDSVEIHFRTRMEAMQAVCLYNGNKAFSAKENYIPYFYTSHDNDHQCKIKNINGFLKNGRGGCVLDCSAYYRVGFIPLEDFEEGVLSNEKLDAYRYKCTDCNTLVQLLGVDVDLNWVAGICECGHDKLKHAFHGTEEFLRIVLPPYGRNVEEDDEDTDPTEPQPMLPCQTPTYSSIKECRARCIPLFLREDMQNQMTMAKKDIVSSAVVMDLKETCEIKGKKKDVYICKASVPKTALWSEEGSLQIGKARLIGLAQGIPNADKVKGEVYEISEDPNNKKNSIVYMEVAVRKGASVKQLNILRAVPKPPSGVRKGIQRAFNIWEEADHLYSKVYTVLKGRFMETRTLGEDEQESVVLVTTWVPSSILTSSAAHHLDNGYVGLDVSLPIQDGDGRIFFYKDSARVLSITEDGKKSVLEFLVVLPSSFKLLDQEFTCRLWAFDKQKDDSISSHGAIPAGAEEDLYDDVDEDDEEDDDDSDDEDVLRDDEDVEERIFRYRRREKTGAPPTPAQTAAMKGYCLVIRNYLEVRQVSRDSPLEQLRKGWMSSPIKDVSLGNFLLTGQENRGVTPLCNMHTPPPRNGLAEFKETLAKDLNDSQFKAVTSAIYNRLTVTQGPPGCGKTRTGAYGTLFLHLSEDGYIIVTAQTNYAADVIFEEILRLSKEKNVSLNIQRMVAQSKERKYNRKKVGDKAKYYTHLAVEDDKDWKENQQIQDIKNAMKHGGVNLLKSSRHELRTTKARIAVKLLRRTDVIVCTVAGTFDLRILGLQKSLLNSQRKLTAIICDEASLLTVPNVVPLINLSSRRLWLLGDHCQLSATVTTYNAKLALYGMSWMEFLTFTPYMKRNNDVFTFLDTQYRCEKVTAARTSRFMYSGKLKSSESVLTRNYGYWEWLVDLPEVDECNTVIYSYSEPSETKIKNSKSYLNPVEVAITVDILEHLRKVSFDLSTVSVICMYEAQTTALGKELSKRHAALKEVDLGTVDSNQGKQSDIVIVNMVRSNKDGKVGFLYDSHRVNVAMSRAKHYTLIITDLETMRKSKVATIRSLTEEWERDNVNIVKYDVLEDKSVHRASPKTFKHFNNYLSDLTS